MNHLRDRAAACGIEPGYHDFTGRWRQAPEHTLESILGELEPHRSDLDFSQASWSPPGAAQAHPPPPKGWGWAVQLYALRSAASWGIGDLGDLKRFGRLARSQGASFLLINPVGAASPGHTMQPSPYYPSSRIFRNPVFLDTNWVPDTDTDELRRRTQELNRAPLIDRDAAWALKRTALEAHFARSAPDDAFGAFVAEGGQTLAAYATFCTIADRFGPVRLDWPTGLRSAQSPDVPAFRNEHAHRVRFHQYLQWLMDRQLGDAAAPTPLVNDLPVGVDPSGADAWLFSGSLAEGFSVGAPPDEFNQQGQDWGAAPFHPGKLAAAGFDPFTQAIQAAFRHAAGLRIDHVMGLFRLFWIPQGCDPQEGTYVRYPAGALLDIVAEQSRRAQAFVVGEDLGTVEPGVREALAARNILSYQLLVFEDDLSQIRHNSMAAVTTHDLPTCAGIWSGTDLADQQQAKVEPAPETLRAMKERLKRAGDLGGDEPLEEAVARIHARLAATDAQLVAATVEDAVSQPRRPNMPGTQDSWPNWCIPLEASLEQIEQSPRVAALARALNNPGRAAGGSTTAT